ncbi:MAG: cytochrome c-type biogenesis protein CcmH, partial [Myxococcota bacterium]
AERNARMGAKLGIIALIALAGTAGHAAWSAGVGHAQGSPPPGMEHEDTSAGSTAGHNTASGFAGMFRPDSPTAEKLMKNLFCLCGGCTRENLYECRCGYAAQERRKVLKMLSDNGASPDQFDQEAYDKILQAFIDEYGGEHVLSNPPTSISGLIPYIAIGGALVLLAGFGRRWVGRGQEAAEAADTNIRPEDEEYAERLDDELSETD